jgi:hypothetical protein
MNTFEVALRTKQLPEKIEDLVPMMFAGQAAVRFMAAKLKAVSDKNLKDPLGTLEEQRKKTVEDGQCMGELLLAVMGKIGELSEGIPDKKGYFYNPKSPTGKSPIKVNKHTEIGLKNDRQLKQAQFIKNHPDIVKETIAECKKNDDIPNITTVMHKHKIRRMEERERERQAQAKNEGRDVKSKLEITIEQRQYISKLEQIVMILPKQPPKDWTRDAFDTVRGYVDVIISRLEYFTKEN